jgi:hypothetical protein
MPIARIDLIREKPASHRRTVGNIDIVYQAIADVLKSPRKARGVGSSLSNGPFGERNTRRTLYLSN